MGGGGEGDELVLVADAFNGTEDTPLEFDLFANDEPVGEWTVHELRVPSAVAGAAPTSHYASDEAIAITGRGSLVLAADGTGTYTPSANVHGAVPAMLVVARGPGGRLRYSTLSFTIAAVNDPPVARDINGVSISDPIEETLTDVTIDLYAAMSDPDGDAVEITLINASPVVYDTPIALTGGTLTIDEDTGLGVIVPAEGRTEPIDATYSVSDGTLTATGNIHIVIAEVQNLPMISPVRPHNASNPHDQARLAFSLAFLQQYGPQWPNIGPPDGEGNLSLVTVPPYSGGQGYYVLNTQEPWLYNRVRGAYLLWRITGDEEYRDIGIEWAELYFAAMGAGGSWSVGTVDPQDAKYKYPENADYYREMTADRDDDEGSTVYYGAATSLYTSMRTSFPAEFDNGSDELWTERNWGAALDAHMRQFYRSGGDPEILEQAGEYVDLILEMSEATGAPEHGHNKHEGSAITTMISSAWMGARAVESMVQYYRHTRREDVLAWIYNYGLWVVDNALYVADHTEEPEFADLEGLRIPAYLAGTGVQFPEGTAGDMRHTRDVGVLLDKAVWAGELLEEDVTELVAARDELLAAALVDDAYFTRTTPLYVHWRVNPPRSWMWQWGNFYALLYDTGTAPAIAPVVLTNGAISGSTQQGSTLTFTPGTERGTPEPTVTWVWQLAGVDIAGTENDLTFETVDVGATRVHVTITNDGGVVEYNTNVITVVEAGTPEITVQPTPQSAVAGETSTFTITATGTPSPDYQWQRSNNGGDTWANVSEGTGGTTDEYTTETLDGSDTQVMVRCEVSNIAGSVTSNEVALSLTVQQDAVAFADSTDFGVMTRNLGSAGFVGWTVAGWLYVGNSINSAVWLAVEGAAGRWAAVQYNNSGVAGVGDSQTGTTGGGFNNAPPQDTWIFVVLRGLTAHPGSYECRWYNADGSLGGTASRASGVEDSLTVNEIHLNGGSVGSSEPGVELRAQHIRGYNRRLSDGEVATELANVDMGSTGLDFFCVFEDDGGGGVTCRDATGNNRTFTLTGATLTSGGPLAPTV